MLILTTIGIKGVQIKKLLQLCRKPLIQETIEAVNSVFNANKLITPK